MSRISKVYQVSEQEFIQIYKQQQSYAGMRRALGYKSIMGREPNDLIDKRCKELNLPLLSECFKKEKKIKANIKQNQKKTFEEIFIENSTTEGTPLKRRVLADHLIPYECAFCGNTGIWNDKKLVLQLDHINGNHQDNRLSNLRFLCPNCHSQTKTFSRKKTTPC